MLLLLPFLFLSTTMAAPVPAPGAAAEPPLAAAERAAHFEEALLRARETGKGIVVLQRGSDWNRPGEMLYHDVWLKDEFARALGDRFILMTVDEEFQWAVPLKVSISPDDKAWTAVASFDKADKVFRVDLAGKGLKARFVCMERLPGKDKTTPPGRFHFRNFLVYGRKLY